VSDARARLPPFTLETSQQKVREIEDLCNSRNPQRVSLAYTADSSWRNRAEFFQGRAAIVEFLQRKWLREQGYRVIEELWAFTDNKIAVRFGYEWHDDSGNWFRSLGNENWEFAPDGLIDRSLASINDVPIRESERMFRWNQSAPRPMGHPGLSDFCL
jgi:nuclear transport factor 2 (NTF2) superfamily protein